MRTFIVKLLVCSLTGPDSTSNASIWSRAGGATSAIAAVFALLLVGQPLGPGASGAAPLDRPFVAAMPAAARTASATAVTAAMTSGLVTTCRNREGQRSRFMCTPSKLNWAPYSSLHREQ